MTRRKKVLIVIFLFLLAILTASGLYIYNIYMTLTSAEQLDTRKLGVNKELNTDIVNVALFGVDGRDDNPDVEGDRTDSIMIGTLDPVTKSIKVTSVMRDTFAKICYADSNEKKVEEVQTYAGDSDGIEWETDTQTTTVKTDDEDDTAEIDTEGEETEETETEYEDGESEEKRVEVNYENQMSVAEYTKINAAYNNGGVESSIKTLNENFDLNIQDYVTVDFNCLMDIIDILGGVTVNIPNEEVLEWTNKYLGDSNRIGNRSDPELTKLGEQQVTGAQALAFVRNRYSDSDFGRAQRQREVIAAILDKAKDIDVFTAINLVTKIYPYVKTSFTLPEMVEYTQLVLDGSSDYKFDSFRVPTNEHGTGGFVDQIWYLFPDTLADNVVALHQFIYGTEKPFAPSYTVEQISQEIDDYMYYSAYGTTEQLGTEMEEEMAAAVDVPPTKETSEEVEEETTDEETANGQTKASTQQSAMATQKANGKTVQESEDTDTSSESDSDTQEAFQAEESPLEMELPSENAFPNRRLGLPESPLNRSFPLDDEESSWDSTENEYSEETSDEWNADGY